MKKSSFMYMYRIVGNFEGKKLSQISEKYDFRGENLRGLLTFATPKDAMAPNFAKKTFVNSHKTTKFAKVFCYTSSKTALGQVPR